MDVCKSGISVIEADIDVSYCVISVILPQICMGNAPISLVSLASALGSVIRLKVLRELAAGDALITVELAERVGIKAGTLGRHLKVLLRAGLVLQNRAGQYSIPPGRLVSREERILDYGSCLLRL